MVFGLTQPPFILEGTLKKHFENYKQAYAKIIEVIENDMYVDDLVTGEEKIWMSLKQSKKIDRVI